ncbi:MAG TPA: T9SS type A sorting domain-containing protein, partial [Flavobacteriales bacterium]|nr:T9SS type A sorting domain-containing protein [Flavobacteriales bacterium]
NPWNCLGLSWFGSDGHTNELITVMSDSLLVVSGADSEVLVYDITNVDEPVLKGGYILPNDTAATWGVDAFGDMVVGNFINTHGLPFQPYVSKYGGVVLYHRQVEFTTGIPMACEATPYGVYPWPNPSQGNIEVAIRLAHREPAVLRIMDIHGRLVHEAALPEKVREGQNIQVDLSREAPGLYYITVTSSRERRAASVALLAH